MTATAPCATGEAAPKDAGQNDERWRSIWQRILSRFEEEAGDPPDDSAPEEWELVTLARLFAEALSSTGGRPARGSRGGRGPVGTAGSTARRALLRLAAGPGAGRSLSACQRELCRIASRIWATEAAEQSLAKAYELERSGDLVGAHAAYIRTLELGPAKPLEAYLRFAQLLRVHGNGSEVEGAALCEACLRKALATEKAGSISSKGTLAPDRRAVLARLAVLLCQEGREDEALPLLRRGGWPFRLAPWVLRFPLQPSDCPDVASSSPSCPARVFDDGLPSVMLEHLRRLLQPGSAFWREHGYNEVLGSGENGYFSYLHPLKETPTCSLDLVFRQILKLGLPHFPDLAEAQFAEWWAHCRPHVCGHQMHFDSDNEGIGGARHPICSSVTCVDTPEGFGGPTLVTDQRLSSSGLATCGWLVHPRHGRLTIFDGSVLHGVVPGYGDPPSNVRGGARRITFMVAFWREIAQHPFGADGLSGSSRPFPDPAGPMQAGPRRYTWHQQLALPAADIEHAGALAVPRHVELAPMTDVWVRVDPESTSGRDVAKSASDAMPAYGECFQF